MLHARGRRGRHLRFAFPLRLQVEEHSPLTELPRRDAAEQLVWIHDAELAGELEREVPRLPLG
jgi:hypothetical protein